MLDVIGAGNPGYKGQNWADVWANSANHQAVTDEINRITSSSQSQSASTSPVSVDNAGEYAMPLTSQILSTTRRSFTAYWRTPEYAVGKFMLHIWTGLFNTFTFWHLGTSTIDMQSRLFSVFLTLVIAPPLIQQLQPRFLHFRGLYEAREAQSRIYSWVACIFAAVLPEMPYSVVAGSVYFCCWYTHHLPKHIHSRRMANRGGNRYFGTWFPRRSFSAGYVYMLLMVFTVFYPTFGQLIASFSPNELLASLLVPAFFTFVVSFCGVVVPYATIPTFWRRWMYWLTPFHYLLEGLLGVITHDVPVRCSPSEFAHFSPPPGQSCSSYAGPFARRRGGYVQSEPDGSCAFCQYASGNQFAENGFNVFYKYKWRDYAIFWSFVVFNVLAVFGLSWVYLIGGPRLKRWGNSKRMKKAK